MSKIELLHGSDHVIVKPDFHLGKTNNDYGRGFYCTRELPMAMDIFTELFHRVQPLLASKDSCKIRTMDTRLPRFL